MKISIITVSFNSASTIRETLSSVAIQVYRNIEYIIVDGQSTDDTLKIIGEYRDLIDKIVSEPDIGIYHAMNKGINLATGNIIGFLNSDDVFYDEFVIEKIANKFFEEVNLDAVYGDLLICQKNNTNKVIRYWMPGQYLDGLSLKGWMPPHPTFYVKRDILLKSQGFDLSYCYAADVDLMIRLFEIKKITAIYLPEILVKMRWGGATTGNIFNIIRGNLEAVNSIKKNGFNVSYLYIFRKVLLRIKQFFLRPNNKIKQIL